MEIDELIAELTRMREENPNAKVFAQNCDGVTLTIDAVEVDDEGDIVLTVD
jgi:hypothetical protein